MRVLMLTCLAGCTVAPVITATCDADDLDCWMTHLSFEDTSGNVTSAVLVDEATVAAIATGSAAPALTMGPASLAYPAGTVVVGTDVLLTDPLDLTFTDPNGCSPVIGLTLVSGTTRSQHTGCFPGLRDLKKAGSITTNVGFAASATSTTSLNVELVALSSTSCASIDDPAALVATASAVSSDPVTIPLTITPPPNSGGGGSGETCAGGLLASTLECDPLGNGGDPSTCITAAEYMQATGQPLPSACAPAGTSGCENSSGTLVMPCCPGLTCEVGAACGDATNAVGGTCH
jgi:hypothetical protein